MHVAKEEDHSHNPQGTSSDSAEPESLTGQREQVETIDIEQLNRNFFEAIVNHYDEREHRTFAEDWSLLMSNYLAAAAANTKII